MTDFVNYLIFHTLKLSTISCTISIIARSILPHGTKSAAALMDARSLPTCLSSMLRVPAVRCPTIDVAGAIREEIVEGGYQLDVTLGGGG